MLLELNKQTFPGRDAPRVMGGILLSTREMSLTFDTLHAICDLDYAHRPVGTYEKVRRMLVCSCLGCASNGAIFPGISGLPASCSLDPRAATKVAGNVRLEMGEQLQQLGDAQSSGSQSGLQCFHVSPPLVVMTTTKKGFS